MAWNAPKTFVDANVLTAADLNQNIRDNLSECGPAKVTTPGQYLISVAANTLEPRLLEKHTVLASDQTTSTSYVDLPNTDGPRLTVKTSSEAIAIWGAQMTNGTSGFSNFMSIAVSGATTIAPDSDEAVRVKSTSNDPHQLSQFKFFDSLESGDNTFYCQYAVGGGTGTFSRRRLVVFPY